MIDPVRRLRIRVAMAPRLFPGVRWSTLCTVYSSPSWTIIIPGRICVALIRSPDAGLSCGRLELSAACGLLAIARAQGLIAGGHYRGRREGRSNQRSPRGLDGTIGG